MKNFLIKLLHLFSNPHFTGLISDPRTQEEKEKDYLHEETELASAAVPTYNNTKLTAPPLPVENQNQTSSCVAHGVTLATGGTFKKLIGIFRRLSKAYIYRQRSNIPAEGMYLQQAFDILKHQGSCLYDTLPTPYSEAEINSVIITPAMRKEAAENEGLEYYTIGIPNDIDALNAIAEQGVPVAIIIFASYREWSQLYPDIYDNTQITNAVVRHCICVIPNSGFMENGKRYLTIQDSAWFGGLNMRHLSEDFIKARVYGACYWKSVALTPDGVKPIHTFVTPMGVGSRGDEVLALQNVLIYEGLLPADLNTGLFAGRTFAAVKALQEKYASEILAPVGLKVGTGYVGSSTLRWLTNKYSK